MIEFILGITMVIAGFIAFWTVCCITFKACFKIADMIFGK